MELLLSGAAKVNQHLVLSNDFVFYLKWISPYDDYSVVSLVRKVVAHVSCILWITFDIVSIELYD